MSQNVESGAEPAYSEPYEICEFCGFVINKDGKQYKTHNGRRRLL